MIALSLSLQTGILILGLFIASGHLGFAEKISSTLFLLLILTAFAYALNLKNNG